ncbi:MAG: glucokinase [Gammaproteobacteria bacterium]|nr:glucokinase [Gammaproteobacteria bacterium]
MNKLTMLVGDIGGTHARFGLIKPGVLRPAYIQRFSTVHYATLDEVIQIYLAECPSHHVTHGALAVATPVQSDRIELTNHTWSFSISGLCQRLGLTECKVINDFTALALSIPLLAAEECCQIGGGHSDSGSALAVIGPGTGLGVSGLIPTPAGWMPLSGEGGHVTIGGTTERELAVFKAFWNRYGHMSAERLISGMGLVETYQVLCALDNQPPQTLSAKAISSRAAAQSCKICEEVMSLFYGWLGVVAGNLALTLGARGGVYIGGGIVPRLLDDLEQSPFRQRFEQRGRFSDYLQKIPTFVIASETPALLGLVHAFDEKYSHIGRTYKHNNGANQ